ncbi:ABC transporter permease [Bacteroidales bacterium OttesenSCG-928-A17]|nr:ABC transporter permease [Bacteroidales bacterium OttesenSCG-928-A17]
MTKLRYLIRKGIADSFIIWRNELYKVFKDVGVIIFFIVVPLVYPLLYGMIYNPETIKEVPFVVVDDSGTSSSREFVRMMDASPDVKLVSCVSDMEEAKRMTDEKKAYGIVRIPSDFSQNIHRGEQTTVTVYIDMSGMLFYKALLLSATEASFKMAETIRVNTSNMAIPYESVAMFNSQGGFASFLVPSILILVIQQTLLLGVGMLTATTRERNRGRLIPSDSTHEGVTRIVFGKGLAYLTVYALICVWALVIVPKIFHLPQIAQYGNILLFALPYLLACIFFAMFVATFIRGRETPMMILVFTSLPILFLSGISWPLSAIPDFWRYFSYIFPSTFGIQGFVKLNSMGASLSEVNFEYQALWLQTGIYLIATFVVYWINIHQRKSVS